MVVTAKEASSSAATQVAGTSFRGQWTLTFDGKNPPGPLRVEGGLLSAADGSTATLKVAKASEPAAAAAQMVVDSPESPITIELSAELPHSEEYAGSFRFTLGGQPFQTQGVRLKRASPTVLPVTVTSEQQASSTTEWDGLWFKSTNSLTFSIMGIPDRSVKINPQLFGLALVDGAAGRHNAAMKGHAFAPAGAFDLAAGKVEAVSLTFDDLAPGLYSGKLMVSADGYQAKDAVFAVSVRRPGSLAAVLVVAGAGLALLLSRLGSQIRPRLVVRTAVSKLLWQIEAVRQSYVLEPEEAAVLDAIRARIQAIHDDAVSDGDPPANWTTNTQAALSAEGAKVAAFPSWVNGRRLLISVTALSQAERDPLLNRLDDVRKALVAPAKLTDAVIADLAVLPGDISRAAEEVGHAALVEAVARVSDATDAAIDPGAKGELAQAQTNVREAYSLLTAHNYPGYLAAQKAAGLAYYRGLVRDLQTRVAGEPMAPDGTVDLTSGRAPRVRPLSQDSVSNVLNATDVAAARRAYESALASVVPPEVKLLTTNLLAAHGSTARGEFPDSGLSPQKPFVPPLRNTTIEDTVALSARMRWLQAFLDGATLIVTAVMGVLLVWAPNAGWGQPTDIAAAFLWGLGLQTVGTSTFQGILGLRSKLSPVAA